MREGCSGARLRSGQARVVAPRLQIGEQVEHRGLHVLDGTEQPRVDERAAFPAPWTRAHKFWPSVGRVESAYGDRNLVCSCLPTDAYADVVAEAES